MIDIQHLFNAYTDIKYPIGGGSDEWWDLKSEFELLDDAAMGLILTLDSKNLNQQELNPYTTYIDDLSSRLKAKVRTYIPKDELEHSERELLIKKLDILSSIYKHYKSEYA